MRFSPFARSAAMSEATSAYVGDTLAMYSNPGGLAHLAVAEVSAQHISQLRDVTYENVAAAVPYRRGGFGLNVGVLNVSDIKRTRYDASVPDRFVETDQVDAGDQYVALGWGRRQTANLALGLSVKVVREKLDTKSASSVMGDLGGIYRVNSRWRVAAVLQNAGPSAKFISQTLPPPTRVRLGAHWLAERWAQWEAEGVYNLDGAPEVLVGGEFNWKQIGFLRLGYRYVFNGADLGSTMGASVGLGVQAKNFQVDYAFLPYGDLGSSHRISVCWRFLSRQNR